MRGQHCNPEEALRIHHMLGAHRSVGMHWGTFALTDEPPRRLAQALVQTASPWTSFEVLYPGASAEARPQAFTPPASTRSPDGS